MVYILGGWQSDFSANWARQGMTLAGEQLAGEIADVAGVDVLGIQVDDR